MKIGFSLSFCIQDILEGRETEDDLTCIVCGTHFKSLDDFQMLLDRYEERYWGNKGLGRKIAERLLCSGRLLQPRAMGLPAPSGTQKWMNI